jgi:opacity protein-like surface antigen
MRPNQQFGKPMKRILATALLYSCLFTPAFAGPYYAGIKIGDNKAGALLGFQINRTFGVEAHYSRSNSSTLHAGLNVDTTSVGKGIVGIATFPMKLRDAVPYDLYAKVGWERTTATEKYNLPANVTLTQRYNGTINTSKNQLIIGGGAEYAFSNSLSGRMGLDFIGKDRNFNVGAVIKF